MDTVYDGYKVVYPNQFPGYFSTWNQANSAAGTFFNNTGKEVKVYGFIGESKRLIKTYRKTSRT